MTNCRSPEQVDPQGTVRGSLSSSWSTRVQILLYAQNYGKSACKSKPVCLEAMQLNVMFGYWLLKSLFKTAVVSFRTLY